MSYIIDELDELLKPETLPLYCFGRHAHYEGSIDKKGFNADWDWELYTDERGEYVLFEQYGSGCIYNFVQHRFIKSPEPTFNFYFDDDTEPRFTIKPSQFGEKYPFIEPLAGKFIGPLLGREIRVVRSFVPMPYTSYCKVTSDMPLRGHRAPGGGWGHIVCHTYSGEPSKNSFLPSDGRYRELAAIWEQRGTTLIRSENSHSIHELKLNPNEEKRVFACNGAALITSLRLRLSDESNVAFKNLWIQARWDGHSQADIELPVGCFFGDELSYGGRSCLYNGSDGRGGFYSYYPMPFKNSAEITLINRGEEAVSVETFTAAYTNKFNDLYTAGSFGYFMSTPYYPIKPTSGSDSLIANISGISGHVVGATITGYPYETNKASCEGDVRIHFDGIRTPQIESDGSESYICYGWGFCCPPQSNPISSYDGKLTNERVDWSMFRSMPGERYTFFDKLHFGIESFGCNEHNMCHSGAILFYGERKSRVKLLGEFGGGEESLTSYFEGDDDDIEVTLCGSRGKETEFTVETRGAAEIVLRRVSDQTVARQYAEVYIDGEKCAKPWYFADSNKYKRWLEDEYIIPKTAFGDKKTIKIRISPAECGGTVSFNQFGISVFGRFI